jgi:TRAP-type uncharacterized transport system substrate-binding protein
MLMDGKRIVFAGAGAPSRGTPWSTLGLVTRRALAPLGYEVEIEEASAQERNTRYVGDGRCDIGATLFRLVRDSYDGTYSYAGEAPNRHLRLIATIQQANWIGVAVPAESDITDLRQIAERKLPIRIKMSPDRSVAILMDYYGLSRELIESWGGRFLHSLDRTDHTLTQWVVDGDFDLIIDPIYAAYTPEHGHWWEATCRYDLRFLPLPADLVQRIIAEGEGECASNIPNHLMRGITSDIPSLQRLPQVIYTRDDADAAFVYEVAKALDDGRELFRETHMPYSYNPRLVAQPRNVPLHDGAATYYREMGYLT